MFIFTRQFRRIRGTACNLERNIAPGRSGCFARLNKLRGTPAYSKIARTSGKRDGGCHEIRDHRATARRANRAFARFRSFFPSREKPRFLPSADNVTRCLWEERGAPRNHYSPRSLSNFWSGNSISVMRCRRLCLSRTFEMYVPPRR